MTVPPTYATIPGFTGYRAGSDGSVWSCRKTGYGIGRQGEWKQLKPFPTKSNGRLLVRLRADGTGRAKNYLLHRLVKLAFDGLPPTDKPLVLHDDGNHLNNRLGNLKYGTYLDNEADKERHGRRLRGDRHPIAKLDEARVRQIKEGLARGLTLQSLADQFDVSKKTILNIKLGRIWKWVK